MDQRAAAEEDKNDLPAAIKDMDAVISVNKDAQLMFPYNYERRGSLKLLVGDFKGAMDDFTLALDPVKPPKPNAPMSRIYAASFAGALVGPYYFRAIAKELAGDRDGAIADLEKYLSSPPMKDTSPIGRRGQEFVDSLVHSYAHADLWVLLMKSGKGREADDQLKKYLAEYSELLEKQEDTTHQQFLKQYGIKNARIQSDFIDVANYLLDKSPESGFATTDVNSAWCPYSHFYYAGMKHLFSNEKKTAITYLKQYMAHYSMNPSYLPEYYVQAAPFSCHAVLSRAELKALGQ